MSVADLSATSFVHESAQEAWLHALRCLDVLGRDVDGTTDPLSVGSGFGKGPRATRELIGIGFAIRDPRCRLVRSKTYTPDLSYSAALALWVLTGSEDLETISFYNPRGRQFTDDGVRVPSAPGRRLFEPRLSNQFSSAIERLRRDPNTRRAMIQIYWPEDLVRASHDSSCFGSIHFMLRAGRLECVATMRSQSAARVLPYDLFLLTMLHEVAAVSLGVELGVYRHYCGSLHYYRDEDQIVTAILNEKDFVTCEPMSPMTSWDQSIQEKLAVAEKRVRESIAIDPSAPIPYEEFGLDRYWLDIVQAAAVGARFQRGVRGVRSEARQLPSALSGLLRERHQ